MSGPRYDSFLSHNSVDKPAVEELAHRLEREGIHPWLDKWHLIPGDPWQGPIEEALGDCASCAVFIGPSGLGSWQTEEMRAAIDKRVSGSHGRFPVIPVLLPGAERPERSRLPAFLSATTWVEFRQTLDDAEAFRRLVCGIRGTEPGYPPDEAPFEGQCPYRGLQPFDEAHASFFFGREALTEWLASALRPPSGSRPANRFLAVIGPSGSGKSSLALAGLVPALKRGEIGGVAWPVMICRPGYQPLESLAKRLTGLGGGIPKLAEVDELIDKMKAGPTALHRFVGLALRDAPPESRLVVLVDQFEEIFTLCDDSAARQALIDNLLYSATIAGGQTVVVLTLRADFYVKCASDPALAAALSDHQLLVGPMIEDELRRAIERPAQLVGCELETGLTDIVMQDVERQPGALPLLQYALRELWERREGRRLTNAAYRAMGGLEGALENRANAILSDFDATERELCRRIFLRLTQPGEGTEDTKRRARIHELVTADDAGEALARVIHRLVDARLITAEGEGDGRPAEGGMIEVAHESLIRDWKELRQWIDADRAGLRTQHRLSEATREWDSSGRHPSYLYTGARLAVASESAAAHGDELNALEAAFLAASQEAERQHEAAEIATARRIADETRKKLRASRLALVSVVVTVALGGVAVWSRQSEQSRRALLRADARSALELARGRVAGARAHKDLAEWEAAVQAAERALSLTRSGVGDEAYLKQVKAEVEEIQHKRDRVKTDLATRRRLEEALLKGFGKDAEEREHTFNWERVAAEYHRAFLDYGIDLDALPNPDVVLAIRASEIRESLTAALDNYAAVVSDSALGSRIRTLAREADPDGRRNAVRDALERGDRSALKVCAQTFALADPPTTTLASLGTALGVVGAPDESINFLQRAQRLHPDSLLINALLAANLCALNPPRYQEVIRYYTAALALRPDSPSLHTLIGLYLHDLRDFDGAIESCDNAIRLDPKFALAYYCRGVAWSDKTEYDKAIADLDEAVRLDPMYVHAYENRGLAWSEMKEFDKAIADHSVAIRIDANYALAYTNRGLAWSAKKEYDKAIADYNQVIRLEPKDALAYTLRGSCFSTKKEYDKAIADFTEVIRLDPKNALAYEARGLCCDSNREYAKAIADYTDAIRLDEKNADGYNALAWLLATCPNGKIRDGSKAVELATRACQLSDFRNFMHVDTFAAAQAECGQFDRAVETEEKAIGLLTGSEGKEVRAEMQERLERYNAKKPYHEAPK